MNIKTISYSYTQNLGNYQSRKIEVSAELEPGESPDEAYQKLHEFVLEKIRTPIEQPEDF